MPTTTSRTPRAPLSGSEKQAAELAVAGLTNEEIGHRMRIGPRSVSRLLSQIGRAYNATARPARVCAFLTAGLVDPPVPRRDAPAFTDEELRLVRAHAQHSTTADIAAAAGMHRSKLPLETSLLARKAGARNATRLVALAFAWGLLGPTQHTGDPR